MSKKQYRPLASDIGLEYTFTSHGPRGSIEKKIIYRAFENAPNVFNLGMGDATPDGFFDDSAISDNHDLPQISRAVGMSLLSFFDRYPTASVFIQGFTESRTRLFRRMLSLHQKETKVHFIVYGLLDNHWEVFESNRPYSAYLIQKK